MFVNMRKQAPDMLKKCVENEILASVKSGSTKHYDLEKVLEDPYSAVQLRRKLFDISEKLPYKHYNYDVASRANCENIIGYTPVPLGIAGPLTINENSNIHLPIATTEGALLASVSRGVSVLQKSKVTAIVTRDFITRAPVLEFDSIQEAKRFSEYLESQPTELYTSFNSTSNHARLKKIEPHQVGRVIYSRFYASTGNAMGVNMVTKGVDAVLKYLRSHPEFKIHVTSIASKMCADKCNAAINYINGRGKKVIVEAVIPRQVLKDILQLEPEHYMRFLKSASILAAQQAGTTTGLDNTQNVIAGSYIALGQDVAYVIDDGVGITDCEITEDGDMLLTTTVPNMKVGSIGGGTVLPAQREAINIVLKGWKNDQLWSDSGKIAMSIIAFGLAGDISLLAALMTKDDFLQAHLKLNRL